MTRRLLAVMFITALLTCPAPGQTESSATVTSVRAQPFFFEALNFGSYDEFGLQSHVDIYVHIPYDLVTFTKRDEFYRGGYTITVLVYDGEGQTLKHTESWERDIQVIDFNRTNNPNYYDLSQHSLTLDPGPYLIEVLFEDYGSHQELRLSRSVTARAFNEDLFSMSDFLLVRDVEHTGGKRNISPQIDPNVSGLSGGFDMFYEIYNPYSLGEVRLSYTILLRGQVVSEQANRQVLKKGLNTLLTHISTTGFTIGSYTLRVTVNRGDDSTETGRLAMGERLFMMEWLSGGAPISIVDLDQAIAQLQYLADDEDMTYIKDAPSEEEKRERFEKFWERYNPTPGSQPNAAMVEYYSRVAFANEHFGHYIEGWLTDRGMVYIVYGRPDYVDRHPLDTDSRPYEVWEYYDVRRRFTFIDETGFGDYTLLYPIWDERNRLR